MRIEELIKKLYATWEERRADNFIALPVKILQYNRCPAVAPLGVLESSDGWNKIGLTKQTVDAHRKILLANPSFAENLRELYEQKREYPKGSDPESQLYDGFINGPDKLRVETVRNAEPGQLADFQPNFNDERLSPLLLHYKARSFTQLLSEDETVQWELWRAERLHRQLPSFMKSLERVAKQPNTDSFLLEELQLWAEAILPAGDDA